MASILPDFEYDIFISYRHNDNRSGWVTEFVNALQEELASTIKDPLSIYFDKNPHDGLLETHNVDKSLEGKLKCLIFIPIISQTYCDPKSFAWQHEFVAFNKLAKEGQFGRDIKLSNGNVASRILPIKIHDLDAEDKVTIEREIGGILRAMEFIYQSGGVNRPLTPSDKKEDNAGKTVYRDQVNKTAHAIKELISAIKSPRTVEAAVKHPPAAPSLKNKKPILITLAVFVIATSSYFFYQQRETINEPLALDKSIAVLPFADMSPNHDQEYFGDGVSEEIINVLAQSEGLKVIARSSSFQFKGKNEDLKKVGEMLGVATILEGSIRKSSDQIRITAQLIKVIDGTHLWSKTFDRSPKDVFAVQDEIAQAVASALKTTLMEGATTARQADWNEEAKKEYQIGRYYFDRRGDGDLEQAQIHFKKSIAIDSSNATVYAFAFVNCINLLGGFDAQGQRDCYPFLERSLRLDPKQPEVATYNAMQYLYKYDFLKAEKEISKALSYGSKYPTVLRNAGRIMLILGRSSEAIRLGEESVVVDPLQTFSLINLATSYSWVGRYEEAINALTKARVLSRSKSDPLVVFYLINNQVQEAIQENERQSGTRHDFQEILIQFKLQHVEKAKSLLNNYIKEGGKEFFPWRCAMAAAYIGDKDLAFEWLEKCYQQKNSALVNIKGEPLLMSLRNDPRFNDLVRRMNFPE